MDELIYAGVRPSVGGVISLLYQWKYATEFFKSIQGQIVLFVHRIMVRALQHLYVVQLLQFTNFLHGKESKCEDTY